MKVQQIKDYERLRVIYRGEKDVYGQTFAATIEVSQEMLEDAKATEDYVISYMAKMLEVKIAEFEAEKEYERECARYTDKMNKYGNHTHTAGSVFVTSNEYRELRYHTDE